MISAFWFFIKNFSNTHVFLKVNRDLSIFLRVLLHLSEVSVDTDLARRKSGDFFSCKGQAKKYGGGGGMGRSREGVGHEVLSLVQGVGHAIFSYP